MKYFASYLLLLFGNCQRESAFFFFLMFCTHGLEHFNGLIFTLTPSEAFSFGDTASWSYSLCTVVFHARPTYVFLQNCGVALMYLSQMLTYCTAHIGRITAHFIIGYCSIFVVIVVVVVQT